MMTGGRLVDFLIPTCNAGYFKAELFFDPLLCQSRTHSPPPESSTAQHQAVLQELLSRLKPALVLPCH